MWTSGSPCRIGTAGGDHRDEKIKHEERDEDHGGEELLDVLLIPREQVLDHPLLVLNLGPDRMFYLSSAQCLSSPKALTW